MSSVAYEVLRAIRALRDDPSMGGEILRSLEEKAKRAFDGAYTALMSPMADRTWEAITVFPGASVESPLAPLTFPRPMEVLGFRMLVVPVSFVAAPPLVIPTLDDLLVSVGYDQEHVITNQQDQTTVAGPVQFASATALDMMNANRLIGLKLRSPQPEMQFTWRWKQGAGVFVDSIVSASVAVRYL